MLHKIPRAIMLDKHLPALCQIIPDNIMNYKAVGLNLSSVSTFCIFWICVHVCAHNFWL